MIISEGIEVSHGLTIDVNKLVSELKLVVKSVNARQSTKDITDNSSSKYKRSVIKRVNHKWYGHDMQRKKNITWLVKVLSIINNRARHIYPRQSLLVFHKIYQMYRDIREQESKEETEQLKENIILITYTTQYHPISQFNNKQCLLT